MPAPFHTICRQPGCATTVVKSGYCAAHVRPAGGWRSDAERGTRQERGYGAEWERTRKRILSRACGLCECEECRRLGRVRVAREVDHIVPKAQGGTDEDNNLQAISRECHKAKTLREREEQRAASAVPAAGQWVGRAWVMPGRGRRRGR